jgi:hypothetical protein
VTLVILLVQHGLVLQVQLMILLQELVAHKSQDLFLLHSFLNLIFVRLNLIQETLVLHFRAMMITRNFAHICDRSKDFVVYELGICGTWPCNILELVGLLLYDFLQLFDLISFSLSELSSLVNVVWVSGKRILFDLEFLNKLLMDP